MRAGQRSQAGVALLIVTGYTFIAFLLIGSLLGIGLEKLARGKREGAVVQARGIAEAGVAKALAAYPEMLPVQGENFGVGYFDYQVQQLETGEIQVTSWGSIHKESSRLPAVRLTTRWKIEGSKDSPRFRTLLWQENQVRSRGQ